MQYREGEQGFSIVELLIVVVVIAILAAITVVAYTGIQQNARTSAQKAELAQLQRRIQVEVLQDTGTSIGIKTPIVLAEGSNVSQSFTEPLQAVQDIALYGVFDTSNNAGASSWANIMTLGPTASNNNLRLRTGSNTSPSARAFYETSAQTNRDLTQSGILNTTGRHIGWVTAMAGLIDAGFDNNPDLTTGLGAHTGWNFSLINLYSNSSYTSVAALVFPEYHDAQTRAQIVQWLNKEYSVGL